MNGVKFSLLLFIFFLQGCLTERQAAEQVFDSGKLPKVLEEKANPKVELKSSEAPNGLLNVAVIDGGTDYPHISLRGQMAWDMKDGKVSGVGYDFLGKDKWPHPNMISPRIFAFGGKVSDEGRITNSLENPLEALNKLNDVFMKRLVTSLKADPNIQKTLFKWVNEQSLNLYAAHYLLSDMRLEIHELYKEDDELINVGSLNSKKYEMQEFIKDVLATPRTKAALFHQPWRMGDDGTPDLPVDIARIEGFESFQFVLLAEYTFFEEEYQLREKYLYPLYRYTQQDSQAKVKPYSFYLDLGISLDNAFDAWKRAYWSPKLSDPLVSAQEMVCQLFDEKDYATMISSDSDVATKKKLIMTELAKAEETVLEMDSFYLSLEDIKESEKYLTHRRINKLPSYMSWMRKTLEKRGVENIFCSKDFLNSEYPEKSKYAENYLKSNHPYLNSASKTKSHGTHVAGVIAHQDSDIDIVPIRVATSSISTTKQMDEEVKKKFAEKFKNWLDTPLGLYASHDIILQSFNNLYPLPKAENRAASKKAILDLFNSHFDEIFSAATLDFYFVDQLVSAIGYIGDNKIKVANASLGFEKNKWTTNPDVDSRDKMVQTIKFLIFEYFKVQLADALHEKAKNTLFVIAAGNSNSWLDGKTRSALPCDLSSESFGKTAKTHGLETPNVNRIENILCVSSLDKDHDLSSFTNLLVSPTPVVFAEGEFVLSTVKSTDCSGLNNQVSSIFPDMPTVPQLTQEQKDEFLTRKGVKYAGVTDDELAAYESRLMFQSSFLASLSVASTEDYCVNSNLVAQAQMSGTSMASPAVAGYVGKMIIAKMKKLGMLEPEIYDDPLFSPKAIIKDLRAESPTLGGRTILSDLSKVVDVKKITSSQLFEYELVSLGVPLALSIFEQQMAFDNEAKPSPGDSQSTTSSMR